MKSATSSFKNIESQAKTTVNNVNRELSKMGQFKSNLNQGFMSSFGIQGGGGVGSLIGSAAGNLLQSGASVIFGAAKDAVKQGIEYADMLQKMKMGFTTILGDRNAALAHVKELAQYGIESAFETKDVFAYAQSLEAVGVKTKEVIGMLQGLGGAAATAGNFNQMESAVRAVNQMLSQNRVGAQEMTLQLAQVIPNPYGMMMRGYESAGYKFEGGEAEFRKMAEEGKLHAQTAVRLMLAQMQKERGDMLDKIVGGTVEGRSAILTDKKAVLYALGMMGTTDIVADPDANSAYAMKLKNIDTLSNLYDPQKSPQALQIAQNVGAGAKNLIKAEDFLESQTFAKDPFGDMLRAFFTGDMSGAEANFKTMATTLGGWIPTGLTSGIKTGIGEAGSAAKELGQGLYDGMNALWEWGSPSKRAIRMGVGIGDGMRIGLLASLEALSKDPKIRAMLDVIGYAEGTDKAHGYRTKVGGGDQGDLSQKNRNIVNLGGGLKSSASGRYQFLNSTWKIVAAQLGLTDFSEHSQDLAAIKLLQDNGAIDKLQRGDFKGAVKATRHTWASFPDAGYGQGERSMGSLERVYSNSLAVGGSPVTKSNPMPVVVVSALAGGTISGGVEGWRPFIPAGGVDSYSAALPRNKFVTSRRGSRTSGTIDDPFPIAVEITEKLEPLTESFRDLAAEGLTPMMRPLQQLADVTKSVTENAQGALDPFKQIEADYGKGLEEGKGKKAKKDKLFDSALTKEGIAGDFQGNLQSFFAGIGHDKPGSLFKNFGMGLLQDIQGRAAHDLSSMLTGALFGTRGEGGNLAGGLLSKLFGSLFGGHRASGGDTVAGRFYVAGEHGPELIEGGGRVHSASQTRGMMGGGGAQRFIFVDDERAAEQHFNASDRNFLFKVRRNQRGMARIDRFR